MNGKWYLQYRDVNNKIVEVSLNSLNETDAVTEANRCWEALIQHRPGLHGQRAIYIYSSPIPIGKE